MWRDSLAELIEDLERVAPDPLQGLWWADPIEQLQQYTDIILYGTDEEIETLQGDPAYQESVRQSTKGVAAMEWESPRDVRPRFARPSSTY